MEYVCLTIGGFYVQVSFFPHPILNVQGAGPGDPTIFRRTELGENRVTLQLVASGAFLNAYDGRAGLGERGEGSIWTEVWWPTDQISLRSLHRLFLCAERGGGNALVANRANAAAWEKFYYEKPPVELLPPPPPPPPPPPNRDNTLGKRKRKLTDDLTGTVTEATKSRNRLPTPDGP